MRFEPGVLSLPASQATGLQRTLITSFAGCKNCFGSIQKKDFQSIEMGIINYTFKAFLLRFQLPSARENLPFQK